MRLLTVSTRELNCTATISRICTLCCAAVRLASAAGYFYLQQGTTPRPTNQHAHTGLAAHANFNAAAKATVRAETLLASMGFAYAHLRP